MPLLMSFAPQYESVTLAWADNASVQFPLNIYATKGLTHEIRHPFTRSGDMVVCEIKLRSWLLRLLWGAQLW